jgi:hypothetical protein
MGNDARFLAIGLALVALCVAVIIWLLVGAP